MKSAFKYFGWVLIAIAILHAGCSKKPHVEWEKYEPGVMEDAQAGDQPILAYFYAAWCPPCYELKKTTFMDPEVIEVLQGFRRIKFDMSFKRSPAIRDLHEEYQVSGLPHMILMWPRQNRAEWIRVRGYANPSRMKASIASFLRRS